MTPRACSVRGGVWLLLAVAAPAAHAGLDLQLAEEHSRGTYGEAAPTRIVSRTAMLRWRGELWMAQLELPWLEVRNDSGDAALPERSGRGGSTVEHGWGDAWLRLGATLVEAAAGRPGVDLVARFKAANGSAARGLGSGARDWALQVEVMQRFGGVTVFGELGRRRTGDLPGARPLHDPWFAELGASLQPLPGLDIGLYHDARERIGRLGPLHETTAYAAWRGGDHRVQLHATRGWTLASADHALGLTWRLRWP
ncbi:MAG: hypothetical protein U1F56_00570 [Rubrivivax sp.]